MKKNTLLLLFILCSFLLSILAYRILPERIVTHWGFSGLPDGYSTKGVGLFLFPVLLSFLFMLFTLVPRIDPFTKNVHQFRKVYTTFIAVLFVFITYLQVLVIVWNSGVEFSLIRLLSPAFAVLFFFAGVLMQKSKRNWFIGIRTPWTMSSDAVWDKTHKKASKLFKFTALLALGGAIWQDYAILFILVPAVASAVFAMIYSYIIYSREREPLL